MICIFDFQYFFHWKVSNHPTLIILGYHKVFSTNNIYTCDGSIPFLTEASCPCQIACTERVYPQQYFCQYKILNHHSNTMLSHCDCSLQFCFDFVPSPWTSTKCFWLFFSIAFLTFSILA